MENDWKTATSLIQSGSHLGSRSSEVHYAHIMFSKVEPQNECGLTVHTVLLHNKGLPVVTLTEQHVRLCVQAHLFRRGGLHSCTHVLKVRTELFEC